jgi:SOS-response transcriptional repressor LexA
MAKKNLSERIKEARLKAGVTQADAAKMLGIAFQTFNKYENNHRVPDAELLNRMVDLFGCDPVWLLTGSKDQREEKRREKSVELTKRDRQRLFDALKAFGENHKLLFPTDFKDLINIPNPYLADFVTGSGRQIFYSWAVELDRHLKNITDLRFASVFDRRRERNFYFQKVSSIPVMEEIPAEFPKIPNEDLLETLFLTGMPSNSFALIMEGDSMNPILYDGDYVVFRPVQGDDECKDGDIVVAILEDFEAVMIKRVSVAYDSMLLKSDNDEYPFYNIGQDRHKIKIVGKAFKVVRTINLPAG